MPQYSAALTCALCHQEGYWTYCIIYIKILDAGATGREPLCVEKVLPFWSFPYCLSQINLILIANPCSGNL